MKLRYIREFLVLERTGEFQTAAKELSIKQSTLSKHIKALEEELGVLLFKRTKQRAALSEFGSIFLPYARRLVGLEDEYLREFCPQPLPAREFVIGLSPSVLQYKVIDILMRFKEEYKESSVVFRENDSGVLREKVRSGECDFAFIRENNEDEDTDFYKLRFACDTLIAALPKDHLLAAYPAITLSQLRREEFLLFQEQSPAYQLCISECRKAGFEPNIIYTGTSGQTLIDLVGRGLGVSLILKTPKCFQRQQEVAYVDLVPRALSYINLICRRDNCSPSVHAFWHFMKSYLGCD